MPATAIDPTRTYRCWQSHTSPGGTATKGQLCRGDDPLVERLAQRQASHLALEEHVESTLAGLGAGGHQLLTRPR